MHGRGGRLARLREERMADSRWLGGNVVFVTCETFGDSVIRDAIKGADG